MRVKYIKSKSKQYLKNTKSIQEKIDGGSLGIDDDVSYLLNQECTSIEILREDRKPNKFTYNVYS